MKLISLLPWWIGVLLALVSYVGLHYEATQPNISPTEVKQMGAFISKQIWHTLAVFMQYLVPVACLIGAGLSVYKQRERNYLHLGVAESPSRNALEKMSWGQFEKLVGEVFRRKGFSVKERGGSGPDGGVDLILFAGNDKYLVQCKQWKSTRIGVATVRELFGVMAAEHAAGGFVVASGHFTDDAQRFAEGRSIELVGTETLLALINETAYSSAEIGIASDEFLQYCPQCGASMVKRTAKKGGRAGEAFWGCSNYPACRGTIIATV